MIESLYIAESGMNSQQKLIEVISNNIANANTPGFKQSQVNFVDLVYAPNLDNEQEIANNAIVGLGVQVDSTSTDFSIGELKQTNNAFDVAINGAGFIEVQLESGDIGYTRAGRLRVNSDGFLTTSTGEQLVSNIQIPPDANSFRITESGEVQADIGEGSLIKLGAIELVNFNNPEALNALGGNIYQSNQAAGTAYYGEAGSDGFGSLVQGFTEMSNVSMTEEMVNLMLAQRGYQLNARILQVSDQVLETINNLRR